MVGCFGGVERGRQGCEKLVEDVVEGVAGAS
jgi:hypothetical protein